MAYHVLVAVSITFLDLSVGLRDSNTEKGTSTALSIGTAGHLLHTDSNESKLGPSTVNDEPALELRQNFEQLAKVAKMNKEDRPPEFAEDTLSVGENASEGEEPMEEDEEEERTDYQLMLWDYNPFRVYYSNGEEEVDLKCPENPDDFINDVEIYPRPFRHVCMLRYSMLRVCKLPKETCTSCKCETNPTDDPGHRSVCPLEECFGRLPGLWVRTYLLPPVYIVVAHMLLGPVLGSTLNYLLTLVPMIKNFIVMFIGTSEKAPQRPHFRLYLLIIQIVASLCSVIFFCLMGMFELTSFPWKRSGSCKSLILGWFQFAMNVQMLVNYYVTWFKQGFTWQSVLGTNALLDVFTVHRALFAMTVDAPDDPPFMGALNANNEFLAYARPRMNLHFLRAYRCLSALMEIQEMGAMDRFGSITKQLIMSSLRLFALVILATGCTVLLEWFGHDLNMQIDDMSDVGECKNQSSLKGNIACTPFLVGIYWVFTTISTVGFGDMTPHSLFSYVLVIGIIVGGVTFFSIESSTLIEVMSLQNNGLAPCIAKRNHVVVSGGAMRDVDEYVMNHFLHQLLHKAVTDQGGEWPFCCILGKVESAEQVIKFFDKRLTPDMKKNIQFCNADPLTPQGLTLGKISTASIVYILPSSTASDMCREDEYNIHVALSVKAAANKSKASPVPFRLVLFSPRSLELAITNGIHPGQCLCLDQLRTAIMAQASEVRGWPSLLMGLSNNAAYDPSQFAEFCRASLFPEEYGESCENCLFGFAVDKTVSGKPFHVLANILYQATGALLICAQIDGKVIDFPWEVVIAPDTVVFGIHNKDIEHGKETGKFCSPIDWRPLFTSRRAASFSQRLWTDEVAAELDAYIKAPPDTLSEEVLAEEDVEADRLKAVAMKDGTNDLVLVIMTAVESYWDLLTMYIEKLPIVGMSDDSVGGFSCIVLVDETPPVNIVEHLRAKKPNIQLAFLVGNWMEPEILREAGAEQAKVIVAFEVNALRATPDNDTRTFFLLRLIARLQLRPECCVLSELTSGMSGAHMIPVPRSMEEQGELLPRQPKNLEEDCFNTSCAAGQVFVPRSLLGLVAKSYYVFGIVEAIQNMTFKHAHGNQTCRPVQIRVPEQLYGKCYGEIVESFLLARAGPHPAACIGVLRETLYSEAVMVHPKKQFRVTKADLLIVLAAGSWVDWAQEKGLRCFGGRSQRTANG